jgi:uncharacterized protein
MRRFFADTFYLIALADHRDQWHAPVVAFSRAHDGTQLFTVDEVLAEFLTFCSTAGGHIRVTAVRTVRQVLDHPQWIVIPQSRASLLDALTLYESRPDKEYSLTDCVSMQAMRQYGLTDVLTNDHHFTQEGFHILFP